MIRVVSGAVDRRYRGLVLKRIDIRDRTGKRVKVNVIGVCSDYSQKDLVKAFCDEHGGGWDPVERFWYCPLDLESGDQRMESVLNRFWAIASSAIAELGDAISMGGIHISVEMFVNDDSKRGQVIDWLKRKSKIEASGLKVAPSPASEPSPIRISVSDVLTSEDEDDWGRVRFVRHTANANGRKEYVYPFRPDPDGVNPDPISGMDSSNRIWHWIPGERSLAEAMGSDGHGWYAPTSGN